MTKKIGEGGGNPGCAYGDGIVVCRGSNNYYRPRYRYSGMRKYQLMKPTTSYRIAVMRAARQMAENKNIDRADVLFCADYYDPIVVLEIRA